jgi:capsular exopolysaccharide synthesis family protein
MANGYKFYEIVERAEKEVGCGFGKASRKPAEAAVLLQPPRTAPPAAVSAPDCYESLKTNILAHHRHDAIKTILFLGTAHGDGVTTTALNFATTLAQDQRLKIFLIEANFKNPCLHGVFNAGPDPVQHGKNRPDYSLKKAAAENLLVVTIGNKPRGSKGLFDSQRFWEFLKTMRAEFDYVILDGPPLHSCSESKAICGKVDGVVMVVASGKTRKQVALRAKKDISEAGGKLLGVVLNKRKYHIPEWVYSRL